MITVRNSGQLLFLLFADCGVYGRVRSFDCHVGSMAHSRLSDKKAMVGLVDCGGSHVLECGLPGGRGIFLNSSNSSRVITHWRPTRWPRRPARQKSLTLWGVSSNSLATSWTVINSIPPKLYLLIISRKYFLDEIVNLCYDRHRLNSNEIARSARFWKLANQRLLLDNQQKPTCTQFPA